VKKERVGLVGLGSMGMPIAKNLLRSGYEVEVCGRNLERLRMVADAGAVISASPFELAEKVDIFVTCLPDDIAVEEVLLGNKGAITGLRPGSIFVDMGTSSASLARRLADILTPKGVESLDAPTSGGDLAAMDGTLTIMVGGSEEAFFRCSAFFNVLGQRVTYMGPAGAGQVSKACNQTIVGATMVGVAEALTLASKNGIDLERLVEAMSAGAASCWVLNTRIPRLLSGDRSPGMRSRLFLKDLGIILQTARSNNIPMPLTSTVHELYVAMVARGLGDCDNSAIVDVLASLSQNEDWRQSQTHDQLRRGF
jgi:2-hydroxy-3-oxopropionate reductase